MFSVSCAQKATKMKAVTMRELETWEKLRRAQAVELTKKRVEERKVKGASNKKRFPVGYGADGRVPGYMEAYISALRDSPLGKPVFSPGRRRVRLEDNMRLPSPSPERRRFVQGASPATVRGQAKKNASLPGFGGPCARPVSSSGRCPTSNKQQKKTWATRSPMIVPTRPSTDARGDSLARPATAPSERPRKAGRAPVKQWRSSPGGGLRRSLSASSNREEQLLKKIARLSGVRQGGEHPTVATLKHAVAIRAVQAQLRECRDDRTAGVGGAPHQAVSGGAPPSPERQAGSNNDAGINTRCIVKRRGRRRGFEPWDNRAPFIPQDKTQQDRGSCPIDAGPLKILTCGDPVFSVSEESPPIFTSASRSAYGPGDPDTPIEEEIDTIRGGKEPSGEVSSAEVTTAAAAAAAARELEACFRRLTISVLIELSHLQHPPKPVRVVLSGLACLLGWQRKRSHRNAPPRSLFSNAYALRNVMASVRPELMTSRRLSAVAKRLDVQEAAPAKVKGANAAASILLDWLRAVVACARAHAQ